MLLYSTNVYLKHLIQKEFFDDVHYVWCSKHFDSTKASHYVRASRTGPTSDPLSIYVDIREACKRGDTHNAKISEYRAGQVARAAQQLEAGLISPEIHDEIVSLAQYHDLQIFRPLLYLIPSDKIDPTRVKLVPLASRASIGEEFIISGLRGSEFQVIEGL